MDDEVAMWPTVVSELKVKASPSLGDSNDPPSSMTTSHWRITLFSEKYSSIHLGFTRTQKAS